jgi:hypothetical protein
LLDRGFILKDGTIINSKPLYALLQLVSKEVTVCPKLKEIHLSCRGAERQNVALAANLISQTVGTALIHYQPGEDKKLAVDTGNFILLMSEWFDLMNVYTPELSIPSKTAYGLKDLQAQNELLAKVRDVVSGMRCQGKDSLQLFQKGIIMSTNALPILLKSVEEYDVKYILPTKLNQDFVESNFGQLRTRGGLPDHPAPLNALYRLRMIMLGKNPGLTQQNTNVQGSSSLNFEEEIIFAGALRTADIEPTLTETEDEIDDPEPIDDEDASTKMPQEGSKIHEIEEDGLNYLGGWLAYKYKKKYPDLGYIDANIAEKNNNGQDCVLQIASLYVVAAFIIRRLTHSYLKLLTIIM